MNVRAGQSAVQHGSINGLKNRVDAVWRAEKVYSSLVIGGCGEVKFRGL
jgi:hypothetical protein